MATRWSPVREMSGTGDCEAGGGPCRKAPCPLYLGSGERFASLHRHVRDYSWASRSACSAVTPTGIRRPGGRDASRCTGTTNAAPRRVTPNVSLVIVAPPTSYAVAVPDVEDRRVPRLEPDHVDAGIRALVDRAVHDADRQPPAPPVGGHPARGEPGVAGHPARLVARVAQRDRHERRRPDTAGPDDLRLQGAGTAPRHRTCRRHGCARGPARRTGRLCRACPAVVPAPRAQRSDDEQAEHRCAHRGSFRPHEYGGPPSAGGAIAVGAPGPHHGWVVCLVS